MEATERPRPTVIAGAAAGLAGLATFLVLHHAWIVPIWFIAPVGGFMAAVGGAAVGASYGALVEHLPRRPWRILAAVAIYAGVMLPALAFAEASGPIFAMDSTGGGALLVSTWEALADVAIGLFGATALAGAIIGGLVGRTRRAAALTALAGVVLAAGPGHNIPLLGATSAVTMELAMLGAVLVVACIVLVEVPARLSLTNRAAAPAPSIDLTAD